MIEEYENLLNCKEHLREKLPMLIEAFVQFYGEDRRKEVEEKLSKAIYIAYREPSSTKSYVKNISEIISHEVMQKIMNEAPTIFTEKELTDNSSLEYLSNMPLYHYQNFETIKQLLHHNP